MLTYFKQRQHNVCNEKGEYNDQYNGRHIEVQAWSILQHKDAYKTGQCGHYNLAEEQYEVSNTIYSCHLQRIGCHGIPGL